MFRLSAVVPAVGNQQSLEETLVSLLTNRPKSCEVIVVCRANYEDRYGLSDEVRFVRVSESTTHWAPLANVGVCAAHGAYVNLVLPGVEVLDDWDVAAIDRLQRTNRLGSVAPLMLDERTNTTADAIAGLSYCGVEPCRRKHVAMARRSPDFPMRIDGPTASCGFFRRQDLLELGGWDERLPATYADVDLAMRLRSRGLASVCDPTSCVVLRRDEADDRASHRDLRELEQLFWSHARQVGARAWFGYAVSWLNPAKVPQRIGGVFRTRNAWTAADFQLATERRVAPAARRAA